MPSARRVLHVDDVPSIRLVIRLALERLGGFTVLSCASAEQALTAVQDFAPHLILLDAGLPGIGGAGLLCQLAERLDLGQVPVVFLTGDSEAQHHRQLLALGAREVLVKPFDPRLLPARLDAILQSTTAERL